MVIVLREEISNVLSSETISLVSYYKGEFIKYYYFIKK